MTDIVLCYTGKSSITGRKLLDAFRSDERFSRVRRVLRDRRIRNTDVFIRWGNGSSDNPTGCIEINTKDAVVNASSKRRMMRLLRESGISIPPFFFIPQYYATPPDEREEFLSEFRDEDGNFFVRGADNKVRYTDTFDETDFYVMQPIDKTREYRVHVFNGEVTAIYEKIPNEDTDGIIRKDSNSKFSRCNPENTRCNATAQQLCIDAVNVLGLTFGGVDIIRRRKDAEGNRRFFVTEVNSSPALNSKNIQKYIDKVCEYVEQQQGEEEGEPNEQDHS